MNNPQYVDRLLVITENIDDARRVVADSTAKDLKVLSEFLEEYVDGNNLTLKKSEPKPVFIKTSIAYSLFTAEEREIDGEQAILLTLVLGFSPMNWAPDAFAEAEKKLDLKDKSIWMNLYEFQEESKIVPVR